MLSPGNPKSPLYPDGLMHPLWVRKYREQKPAVMVAYFDLPAVVSKAPSIDPLSSSSDVGASTVDVQLAERINDLR